ncbi:serine/threonine-protein kinase [Rubrivirga litoralis]|uniref:Serine/threonine-protein kinase n=1 Tax=Rubrivirga litoralis TaxID=3075598 RepID=A0ABU3BRB8_9BACT|nr:serine/threonine-protein kinase [Rubrivirga sp. F394]MDT0631828.1 serine/threonine-protein kinase [Rubrivirga sp. F394]
MTPDRWRRVSRLFDAAADIDVQDRSAYLDREVRAPDGGPDPALRAEVERLLDLDGDAGDGVPVYGDGLSLPPPERAGPWRLVERVGEGGMGEVWRAERADGAYRAEAAVKLVRPGLAPDLVARFRAERHVLARLDHPAIARLLDGGTASDGRPYLALGYVRGEPITDYCDRRQLGVAERLALFGEVCQAVAYAHRMLVVHRDIKPSNVLVEETPGADSAGAASGGGAASETSGGGAGRVKLLDFGIAKLLDEAAPFTAPVTAADRRVMTPQYAAPEQVRGEDATTATDVYGLGALLYELLTGRRPYAADGRTRAAVERAVLEATPPEPSVTTAEGGAEARAAARSTDPARLRRRLRGDLDRIVLKALRKEPERRYDGPAALARDLERHLAGLPVEARPDSVSYRARSFVRRHRQGVAATAAGVVLVAALVTGYTLRLSSARAEAEAERAASDATVDFLIGLFEEGDPLEARGDTATVYDLLDRGTAQVRAAFADHPRERGRLQVALARIHRNLGDFGRADSLYRAAGALAPTGTPLWTEAHLGLASVLKIRGDYDGAERVYRRAFAAAPPENRLHALGGLANVLRLQGDLAASDSLYALVLDARRTDGDSAHLSTDLHNVGVLRADLGRPDEGARALREALRIKEQALGPDHLHTALTLNSLAVVEQDRGRPAQAEALYRRALAVYRTHHGEAHDDVAAVRNNLGALAQEQGDLDGALREYRAALGTWRTTLGDSHPYVAIALVNIGSAYHDGGRYADAERYYQDALARDRASLGDDHVEVGVDWALLGALYHDAGRDADAEAAFREAARRFDAAYPPGHPDAVGARVGLARALDRQGRRAEVPAALRGVPPAPPGLDDETARELVRLRL